jgi:tetratricopeptide (TPR) repeat protein
LARRPDDGRSLLGAGLAAAAQMNLPQAVAQLKQAARSMPTHLGTWNALAWMHIVSGQLDDAQAALEKANAVEHNFAENHGGLAVVAAMKGDAAQARELIRTALKLDRNCFSAAYAAMLLQHGPADRQAMLESAMQFLAKQRTPDGGSLQQAVLRMASRTGRKPATRQ